MKITALEAMSHKPGMYRVAVDKRPVGYICAEDIFDLKLVLNQDIDPATYERLVQQVKFNAFYSQGLSYADRRLRSRKEVEHHLSLKGSDAQTSKRIADRLQKLGIIDEEKLAQAFVHDAGFKPVSKRALAIKLKQKNIDQQSIDRAIVVSDFDEDKALDQLIAQKSQLSSYVNNKPRFIRFLISRGFAYDDIVKRLGKPDSRRGDRGGNGTAL